MEEGFLRKTSIGETLTGIARPPKACSSAPTLTKKIVLAGGNTLKVKNTVLYVGSVGIEARKD